MEFLADFWNLLALISATCGNAEKLSAALISCGVVKVAVALCLVISKAPGGILLHHDKAPFFLYYGILIFVVIFGVVEASVGFWVSGDVVGRHATGKTILWLGLLPIVFVAALGGFVILSMK
ncbi:hypothetical protein VPH35_031444 [Triticum aestivum]